MTDLSLPEPSGYEKNSLIILAKETHHVSRLLAHVPESGLYDPLEDLEERLSVLPETVSEEFVDELGGPSVWDEWEYVLRWLLNNIGEQAVWRLLQHGSLSEQQWHALILLGPSEADIQAWDRSGCPDLPALLTLLALKGDLQPSPTTGS